MPEIQLTTPRLILRPWRESDAEDLFELASDPLIGTVAGWKPHESVDESSVIIGTVFAKPLVFAIVLRSINRPVGCVGLELGPQILKSGPKDAELGYWIGRRYWNQGFATEAAQELIRYGFEEAGIPRIWCQTFDENRQSARVQEKCGFSFDHKGLFRNPFLGERVTVVSSLTRKDWARRRNT